MSVKRKLRNFSQATLMVGGGRESTVFVIRKSQKFPSTYFNGAKFGLETSTFVINKFRNFAQSTLMCGENK